MKKTIFTLIVLLLSASVSLQAQESKIRAGAGLVYATDINNLGLALKGVYAITPEWEGAFGFTHILKKDYVSYNIVDLDAHYVFAQTSDEMSFYGLAGLALNFWKVDFGDLGWGLGGTATGSDAGLNLGVGMNYLLSSNLRLVPEVRFTVLDGSFARLGATVQYSF